MHTIFQACEPRSEVLSGDLREDIFAARLRDVIEGTADPVYEDPTVFFDNTYPTEGLKLLLNEALGRLTSVSPANNAIIRLETAFGGGKTHNLIALYHTARGAAQPGPTFVDPALIPQSGSVQIAGVVGSDLDPSNGLYHPADEIFTYTLWGELAYQLGGVDGYNLVVQSDQDKTAPGTGWLGQVTGEGPTLIMLDEIARHLRVAKATPTATERSDLAEQTVAFLMSLLEFAASKERLVVVFTLAERSDAFGEESEELIQALAEARRISARQERVITPTGETEIAAIVTHRLFQTIDRQVAAAVAQAYADYYRQCVDYDVNIPQRALRAEYMLEIEQDYPFHPELLTTLNRKTSTIPNFQKTRGALRLLAMVVRELWAYQSEGVYLIHPHDLNLASEEIANDLTSRLERPRFRQVVEADIVSPLEGSQAHAKSIDDMTGGPPYAIRVGTTAFLHSLTQGVASGVDPADLMLGVIMPSDDPALVDKAAEHLVDQAWFFEYDGHRYRFKTEPSLNKIVADEMELVGLVKSKMELDQRIHQVWKKGFFKPIYFPSEPADVEDNADVPKLVVIHYDAAVAGVEDPTPPDMVAHIFNHTGVQEGYRTYKNNVLFLVADQYQADNMVDIAQRYLAINRIIGDPERMSEFYEDQRKKLKHMEEAAKLELRVAITKAYRYLYYPSAEAPQAYSNLAREQLPPQDQGNVSQDQSEVVLSVLTQLQKVQTHDASALAGKYVKSKAWDKGQTHLSTEDLRRAFARKMGLRMMLDVNQLKKTIRNGIEQGEWVYYDSHEQMGYSHQSPQPAIQVSEDAILYTPEEYEQLGWSIKGVTPVAQYLPGMEVERCPVCGNPTDQCICGRGRDVVVVQLHGEGAPGQAFQALRDACADNEVEWLRRLSIYIEGSGAQGARETRALGLAIPQLGKGDFRIKQHLIAQFDEDEDIDVNFSGGWDRYKRLKQVTDAFGQEAARLSARSTLYAVFPDGLNVNSDQFQTIHDVFMQLDFGHMIVDAEPFEET